MLQIDKREIKSLESDENNMLFKSLEFLGLEKMSKKRDFLQLFHISGALTNNITPREFINEEEVEKYLVEEKCSFFPEFKSIKQTLNWFNKKGQAQRSFIRPIGLERYQMSYQIDVSNYGEKIVEKFKNLGYLDQIIPNQLVYDALIILGASHNGFRIRLDAAAKMILNKQIDPSIIILVGGERDLWPRHSKSKTRGEAITTEMIVENIRKYNKNAYHEDIHQEIQRKIDEQLGNVDYSNQNSVKSAYNNLIQYIKEKYNVKWPTEMDMMIFMAKDNLQIKEKHLKCVNSPKILVKKNGEWILERPNTKSSLEETVRKLGDVLMLKNIAVMSSQPYCQYQGEITRMVLGQQYRVKMIAPAINDYSNINNLILNLFEAFFSNLFAFLMSREEELDEEERINFEFEWKNYIIKRSVNEDF